MIYKGLDDEEATFLQFVAEKKAQLDTEQKQAENKEILAFRVRERQCTTLASSLPLPTLSLHFSVRPFLVLSPLSLCVCVCVCV